MVLLQAGMFGVDALQQAPRQVVRGRIAPGAHVFLARFLGCCTSILRISLQLEKLLINCSGQPFQ
jgi:hypothetical protein